MCFRPEFFPDEAEPVCEIFAFIMRGAKKPPEEPPQPKGPGRHDDHLPERRDFIPSSKGYPAWRDPAAERQTTSVYDGMGEGDVRRLKNRYAPNEPRPAI